MLSSSEILEMLVVLILVGTDLLRKLIRTDIVSGTLSLYLFVDAEMRDGSGSESPCDNTEGKLAVWCPSLSRLSVFQRYLQVIVSR